LLQVGSLPLHGVPDVDVAVLVAESVAHLHLAFTLGSFEEAQAQEGASSAFIFVETLSEIIGFPTT